MALEQPDIIVKGYVYMYVCMYVSGFVHDIQWNLHITKCIKYHSQYFVITKLIVLTF